MVVTHTVPCTRRFLASVGVRKHAGSERPTCRPRLTWATIQRPAAFRPFRTRTAKHKIQQQVFVFFGPIVKHFDDLGTESHQQSKE